MAYLLHLDASPRGERSHSRRLTREFVKTWKQFHPRDTVTYRELGRNPIPYVDEAWITATFTPPELRTRQFSSSSKPSSKMVSMQVDRQYQQRLMHRLRKQAQQVGAQLVVPSKPQSS